MSVNLSVSPIAASLPVSGFQIRVGTAGSPESFSYIANVQDYNRAQKSTVVMVTNVGDLFVRRQPTIVDPGAPTFKIYYIPEETSHRNSVNGGTVTAGLVYLQLQQLLRDWQAQYPPDPEGNSPEEAYKAFVTDFGITGKIGGVFEAQVTLGINDGNPTLP